METEYLRADALLMELLQERKTITGFLDMIFGFLRRNTDFYHVQKNGEPSVGFQKGVREQLIFGAMQRYDPECGVKTHATTTTQENYAECTPPVVETEIEVETTSSGQHPSAELQPKHFDRTEAFDPTEYKNGAVFENYCWSQTLKDVELHVKLPSEWCTAKQLAIDIRADSITIKTRSEPPTMVFAGQISGKFKHNDALWTISEGKLVISIDKPKEIWWDRFLIKENCIDPKNVDCERSITDLPEESQIAIQKLRVQQMEQDKLEQENRTALQKSETLARLRKAWDAEGSPFTGQPFDSSMIQFS